MPFSRGPNRANALLHCLTSDGRPRYDLPAKWVKEYGHYDIFWRPAPATVVHHIKRRNIVLGESELVLVGIDKYHCLSVSVDCRGHATGIYANINLVPTRTADGWCWRDLELDVKLVAGHDGAWLPVVVDVTEFDRAPLSDELRRIASAEVGRILQQVTNKVFPFGHVDAHSLGLSALGTSDIRFGARQG